MFGRDKPRPEAAAPDGRGGWFSRLRAGLGLSKDKITDGIDAVIAEGAPAEEGAARPGEPEAPPPPQAPVPEPPERPEIEPGAPEAPAPEAPETPEVEPAAPEAPAPAAPEAPEIEPARRRGLTERLLRVVTRRRLDDVALEALEDVLITADIGPATASRLVGNLARGKFDKDVSSEEVRAALAADVETILAPVAQPLALAAKPHVVLVVGVNGTGKTTTIGKLGKRLREDGHAVMFCAGDTFRAAAIEQLKIWGERAEVPVVARAQGADAAGLAYDALERARAEGVDALLIDTAGRLHNRADLMAELEKIIRVLKKLDPAAPHSCLLVLDATTGQNAHAQVQTFQEMVNVTGLVVTKLDGSARGGVIVGLADRFGLPVHAVGVGEGIDDLRPFGARTFARSLMGLDG